MPVEIWHKYDGYSWTKLPTIQKVELTLGDKVEESWLCGGTITCVDSLVITAHCSDGKVFSSPVCMAVALPEEDNRWEEHVLVTPDFRDRVQSTDVWYHLGGCSDDGDTYDTQLSDFEDQLDDFCLKLAGPDESLRRRVMALLEEIPNCRSVRATDDRKSFSNSTMARPKFSNHPRQHRKEVIHALRCLRKTNPTRIQMPDPVPGPAAQIGRST